MFDGCQPQTLWTVATSGGDGRGAGLSWCSFHVVGKQRHLSQSAVIKGCHAPSAPHARGAERALANDLWNWRILTGTRPRPHRDRQIQP